MGEASLGSASGYFTELEEVSSLEGRPEVSSVGNQLSPEMGISTKRKRSPEPKSFPQSGYQYVGPNGAGRRRTYRDKGDVELCAKRMKWMSLQDQKSSKVKKVNPFDIDAGYEGDCEAN